MISDTIKKTVEGLHKGGITVQTNLCSRIRSRHSECSYCTDVCPANAIIIHDNEIRADERCIGCGVCYSACPNSVFAIPDRDDTKSLLLIKKWLERSEDRTLRIKCDRVNDKKDGIFNVPCLGRLTEELLLGAICHGVNSVQILKPACDKCHIGKASSRFLDVFVLTQNLMNALKIDPRKIKIVENFGDFNAPSLIPDSPVMDRRAFFKSIGGKTISIAEKALNPEGPEKPEEFIYDARGNQKRNLLLKIIESLYCVDRLNSDGDEVFASGNIHFGRVSINSPSCIGCKVCAALCPSGALKAEEDATGLKIYFRQGLCINCGICADACQQKAIKVAVPKKVEDALGPAITEDKEGSLILNKEKKVCLACNSTFYSKDDCCISCINIKEKKEIIHQSILSMEVE